MVIGSQIVRIAMKDHHRCEFKGGVNLLELCEIPDCWKKILAEWSKNAIRTRPSDLLRWSTIYFDMKSKGERPPTIPFLNPPDVTSGPGGLTPNVLKALAASLPDESETYDRLETIWDVLSLDDDLLSKILKVGKFRERVGSKEFLGIAAAHLTDRLRDTMILLCDVLSADEANAISLRDFTLVYTYLARLRCADVETTVTPVSFETVAEIDQTEEDLTDYADRNLSDSLIPLTGSLLDDGVSSGSVADETVGDDRLDRDSGGSERSATSDDRSDVRETVWEMYDKRLLEPPLLTSNCDDPEFLSSLKKLREDTAQYGDHVSIVSSSTVISEPEQSVGSIADPSDGPDRLDDEFPIAEDHDVGETQIAADHVSDYVNYDGGIYDAPIEDDDDETFAEQSTFEVADDLDRRPSNVNRDFIVMLALVSDAKDPAAETESDDDDDRGDDGASATSATSDFSLLEKTSFDDRGVDAVGGNDANVGTFEDDYRVDGEHECSDSATSGEGSARIRRSEIGVSNVRSAATERSEGPELASTSSVDRFEEDLSCLEAAGPGERDERDDEYDERCDERSELSASCSVEMVRSDEELYVLRGVGPAVPEDRIRRVIKWVTKCARNQSNLVRACNLSHFLCPPLDLKFHEPPRCGVEDVI